MSDMLTDGSRRWSARSDVFEPIVLGERSYDDVSASRRFVANFLGDVMKRG